ncbi:MAG: hypothetical protein JZU58_09365 [Curvibacter lanceolatus]|uniref:hypothetical protein n=1 Tax=Curvibacter lanceolatus TaxID=86182 RepID=UPI002355BF32|nr:hypothetical protein [Curvibacter lanceolatus]MBV5292550.1 hypothetical protein [Curvibacter lanceolatus]
MQTFFRTPANQTASSAGASVALTGQGCTPLLADLVRSDPSNDERLYQEALGSLRWITAGLRFHALPVEPVESFSFPGRVPVAHVVSEFVEEFEGAESFDAWRCSDEVNAIRHSLGIYRGLCAAHGSQQGGEA